MEKFQDYVQADNLCIRDGAERGNKKRPSLPQHEYNFSALFVVGMYSHAERGNKKRQVEKILCYFSFNSALVCNLMDKGSLNDQRSIKK